jgi:plasmid stabilization system protein ParE
MKVYWSAAAEQDRADIIDGIGLANPLAAIRMDDLFAACSDRLADHPLLGRAGIVPGTRELFPHGSYRLVYELDGNNVWIMALVHTARAWPHGQMD